MNYIVKKIDNKKANEWQISRHYMHRKTSSPILSVGLFDNNNMIGVCIFSRPASQTLCKGICGVEEKDRVVELSRLFIIDETPQNTESWFISRAIKLLKQNSDKDILVSYADSSVGHSGIIYRATSFLFTGLTKARYEWGLKSNPKIHSRSLFRGKTLEELRELYGDDLIKRPRSRKYRYIKFIGSKTRKRKLRKKLKYEVLKW